MSPLRVSPSLLESYRLYATGEWMSLQDIEGRIKREPITPTPEMRLGTAFHAIAEHADILTEGCYEMDGFLFDAPSVNAALALLPRGVCEVPCSRILKVGSDPVLIGGRIDRVAGEVAWELKTKTKPFEPERFADSLQWQCYAWMLGVPQVRYLLVELTESGDKWAVRNADTLGLYAYLDMESTLRQWTALLLNHAQQRDLLSYLNREEYA